MGVNLSNLQVITKTIIAIRHKVTLNSLKIKVNKIAVIRKMVVIRNI
jgi:hypothetical protein